MLRTFNKKYPSPKADSRSLMISICFGVFIGLFLLFFRPFFVSQYKVLEVLFYGFITTFVLFIFLFLLPLALPSFFKEENWRVKDQILFYFLILFVIATLNGLYTNYINALPFTWSNYWWIISRTFVLGGIPIAFITLLDQQRKATINNEEAEELLKIKGDFSRESRSLYHKVSTDLKSETISFSEDEFNYATAVGNYTDVFLQVNNTIQKSTYRITLSAFKSQLNPSTKLIRCHRSHLVNIKKVKDISGNAQGLKLELENQSEMVPVSRSYIPMVKNFLVDNK